MASKPFMEHVADRKFSSGHKVTIVGCGNVGMAIAISLLSENITNELVIVDMAEDKVKGEILDLQQGSAFTPGVQISGGTSYADTANSKICIITAGARQKPGQSRLELVQQNVSMLKVIVPKLLEYSPDTILLLVSNPVDILTYATWKISCLPINKVFGTGTSLDTGRLKYLIAQEVGVNISAVSAWIIGEHGDASVPVWSRLEIAGVPLTQVNHPSNIRSRDRLDELHKTVINSAAEIIKLKGYTSWAIGLNTASICRSILQNQNNVHALTTLVQGYHGVEEEMFLSLPCVVGANGITDIIPLNLEENEKEQFRMAAKKLSPIASELGI